MSIIGWIIFGVITGFIASKIVNKQGEGFILNMVLGIVGAMVGGFLATQLGFGGIVGFNIGSMVIAIVGAIIVLFVYNAIVGRRPTPY